MTGHANSYQKEQLKELEKRLDPINSPIDELLYLGWLYLEPFHQEDKAISIFEKILNRDPLNIWASYWLAYCYEYYLMDKTSLLKAMNLLQSSIKLNPRQAGPLYILLQSVLSHLNMGSSEDRIYLLIQSIKLEPTWVVNRWLLANEYLKEEKFSKAIQELRTAKSLLINPDPNWDDYKRYFEAIVTGRTGKYISEDIDVKIERLK